jgi:hypothetical protein
VISAVGAITDALGVGFVTCSASPQRVNAWGRSLDLDQSDAQRDLNGCDAAHSRILRLNAY